MTSVLSTRISLPDADDAEIEVEYSCAARDREVTIHSIRLPDGTDISQRLSPRQVSALHSQAADDHDERMSSAWDSYQQARRDCLGQPRD